MYTEAMNSAKEKITTAVSEYQRLFPQEYKDFLNSKQIKLELKNDKWASTGKSTALERHLFDMPEKLYTAIKRLLNDEELSWFNGRDEYHGDMRAVQWFMRTFPQFKITQDF